MDNQNWERFHKEPGASLVDVARRAEVSPTTVSRFFNRPDLVRPGTRRRIERAVAALGMAAFRRPTATLLAIGLVLAFLGDPELLILDEPTSGLDPVLQEEFRKLLAERKTRGVSIWLTSHVMAEVERVADRVGLIRDGKLARELAMDDLRHQTTGRIRLEFTSPIGSDAFEGVDGVTSVAIDGSEALISVEGSVAALLRRAGELGAVHIETQRRDLDDIFLELFEGKAS